MTGSFPQKQKSSSAGLLIGQPFRLTESLAACIRARKVRLATARLRISEDMVAVTAAPWVARAHADRRS
jgi:hypothetical protein